MLVIQPTADGRLRIYNNHRSDFARDESSARTLAYNWGHTDISINKALSEMRTAARGEAQPTGWRVGRAEPTPRKPTPRASEKVPEKATEKAPERVAEPIAPRVEMAAPVPERAGARKVAAPKLPPNTVLAPTKPVAPAPKPPAKSRAKAASVAATPPLEPAAKTTVKAPAKAVAKASLNAVAPREAPIKQAPPKPAVAKRAMPKEAAPKQGAAVAPREKALSLFRAGVKELAGMEEATLAFARGPWSESREMAEYITACLEGKRPKTGWERK